MSTAGFRNNPVVKPSLADISPREAVCMHTWFEKSFSRSKGSSSWLMQKHILYNVFLYIKMSRRLRNSPWAISSPMHDSYFQNTDLWETASLRPVILSTDACLCILELMPFLLIPELLPWGLYEELKYYSLMPSFKCSFFFAPSRFVSST